MDAESGTDSMRARRVAPERVEALARMSQGLRGGLGRRPVGYGSALFASLFLITVGLSTWAILSVARAMGLEQLDASVLDLGIDIVGAVCVIVVLSRLGWWRSAGFGGRSEWRSLALFILPAVLVGLMVAGGIASIDLTDPVRLGIAVPRVVLTGFWEEGLTRGFLLTILLIAALRSGRGPVGAVIASAVIFGLLHLVRLLGAATLPAVLPQVVYATLLGVGFGALLLRTNALWLLVVLHALFNFASELPGDREVAAVFELLPPLVAVVLAVYGLFLLRRVKAGVADSASQYRGSRSLRT